jgi:cytochrome c(L)
MMKRGIVLALTLSGSVLCQFGNGWAVDNGDAKKLNPYTGQPEMIQEGRTLYLQNGCSGCHGVMGGGGMGPPLIGTTTVWKYGSDDETLFKLIKGQIPEQKMPKVFGFLEDEKVWKILAYIRSLYKGDPTKINW